MFGMYILFFGGLFAMAIVFLILVSIADSVESYFDK